MKNITMLWFCLFLMSVPASILAEETHEETEFLYKKEGGKGPTKWGELKKEWSLCKNGTMQSPVDFSNKTAKAVPESMKLINKSYEAGDACIKRKDKHIEVAWKNANSTIMINGTTYKLLQGHWHSPSEHAINGRRFELELHLVHKSSENKIVVIGLLYQSGAPNDFLEKLMAKIKTISDTVEEVEAGVVNPTEVGMKGDEYYRYMGSLTTPPCTEGVIWNVNKVPITVSKEQAKVLRQAVHGENARPVQRLNGREVELQA